MKQFQTITIHTLLKPTSENELVYWFIRTHTSEMPADFKWNVGYINHLGTISIIDGSFISGLLAKELEADFQTKIKKLQTNG